MKDNEGQREAGEEETSTARARRQTAPGRKYAEICEPKDELSAQVKENLTQDQRHGHQGRGSSGRHRTAN